MKSIFSLVLAFPFASLIACSSAEPQTWQSVSADEEPSSSVASPLRGVSAYCEIDATNHLTGRCNKSLANNSVCDLPASPLCVAGSSATFMNQSGCSTGSGYVPVLQSNKTCN